MDKLAKVSYILKGVDPDSRLSLFCYAVKTRITYAIPYKIRNFYHKHVRTLWDPKHTRIRNVIPKDWHDLDYVLLQVNFEIIKSFYEDEFLDGPVDWNADEKHKDFADWLFSAYHYITVTRPKLEKEKDAAYPDSDDFNRKMTSKKLYKELYGEVDRIEKHIHKMDTKVLTELIKNRDFLWT
jgi:hypothetical protein